MLAKKNHDVDVEDYSALYGARHSPNVRVTSTGRRCRKLVPACRHACRNLGASLAQYPKRLPCDPISGGLPD